MIGGGGQCDIFFVNADHTKIITTAGGETEISTVLNKAIRIGKGYSRDEYLIQSDFSVDEDGKLTVALNHTKFDGAWNTLMKAVNPRTTGTASSAVEEVVDELGVKGGGAASASSQDVLLVSYGAKDADGKIPVVFAIGNIAKTTSFSFQANTFGKPSFSFISKGCLNGDGLDISDALDIYVSGTNAGGVLATGAAATLAKDTLYDIAFLTPHTVV